MRQKPQPQSGDIWRYYGDVFFLIEKSSYIEYCWDVYNIIKSTKHTLNEKDIYRYFTKLA